MKLKNIVKMGWGVLAANIWERRSPLNVMLSVTNRCSSRCNYCDIPSRRQRELTTDEIFSLIDQICEMGCQRLGLWGGEPLIRDDVGQIIDYAKNKNLFVTLDSNGYLLPEKMKMLNNLDHLVLGLDGPEEVHDLNREPGSFKRVMAAIEMAKGKKPFWTITVLTKNNLDSIDFILNKAREYSFLTTFQLLHHNDRLARNQEALSPPNESYKRAIEKLILEKKKGAPIASSLNYLYYILNWPDYKTATYPNELNSLKCWAGRLYCNVDTDGSIYPCSLLVDKIDSLNFLEVGFKRAFEGLKENSCKACLASCFTEYNYLYSLDFATIVEWLKSMRKTNKYLCRKISR
jgi:MoaA/NifB/PqqE/SkfB family radical SAM enzyme